MNRQFDVIIIGDSVEGNEVVKSLIEKNSFVKIAFVSRDFKNTQYHNFMNVEYIKDEVLYTDYRNRLFGCYLKSNDRLFSTHLVVASGLKYEPFTVKNTAVPCVFNNTNTITRHAKTQPAIVIGSQAEDIKLALAVAKKYKHVYLCTETHKIDATAALLKKLDAAENIVVLPNTVISSIAQQDGVLKSVTLSNYSTLTCSAIFVKTKSAPETSFISNKLIDKDENGYILIKDTPESSIVPKCFAVGNCTIKSTKKTPTVLAELILNDF